MPILNLPQVEALVVSIIKPNHGNNALQKKDLLLRDWPLNKTIADVR